MSVENCCDIHALPEDCLANALSLTSPKDACRLAAVASSFRAASESDAVWERFLPSDYRTVLSRCVDGADSLVKRFASKKELYMHLCDHPILIDGGTKSFSLEKSTGKKCYTLAARDLFIVWGDTEQYWRWYNLPESRFSEVAELLNVCWFEIRGSINASTLSPNTNYAAYLVYTTQSRIYGFEHQQAETSVKISSNEEECDKRSVYLDPEGGSHRGSAPWRTGRLFYHRVARLHSNHDANASVVQQQRREKQSSEHPTRRENGWMEVELGEFYVKEGQEGALEMSVMEVNNGNWKGGLIVEGIEIRPKKR